MRESLKEINDRRLRSSSTPLLPVRAPLHRGPGAYRARHRKTLHDRCHILVDEQRWDGQERSTRYQDFRKSGYFTPEFGETQCTGAVSGHHQEPFCEYEAISEGMFRWLEQRTPSGGDEAGPVRTHPARRAFDISRYMLPLAHQHFARPDRERRTLETQISRLLSNPFQEVRTLGALLKDPRAILP